MWRKKETELSADNLEKSTPEFATKPKFRLGSIGLDWTHPHLEVVQIHPSMSITKYDGIIINAMTWFEKLAPQVLEKILWETDRGPETSFERGHALQTVIDQFTRQVVQLCSMGGVVVVLADLPGIVRYSLDREDIRQLHRAMYTEGNYAYVSSMHPFFGAPFTQYGAKWRLIPRDGKGSIAVVRRSTWTEYLNQSVQWRVIVVAPDSYLTIASTAIRDNRPSTDVLATIRNLGTGQIAVLPHPACNETQDTLIECVYGFLEGPRKPDWLPSVEVPAVESLKQEIAQHESKITELEQQIEALDQYKDLLFETGDALEEIVGMALQVLDLNPRKPEVKGTEDWLIDLPDGETGVCEVTGADGSIPKKKATQLLDWKGKHTNGKGILIVNPMRMRGPEEKSSSFRATNSFHAMRLKSARKTGWLFCSLRPYSKWCALN